MRLAIVLLSRCGPCETGGQGHPYFMMFNFSSALTAAAEGHCVGFQ
jgi:hypothetical protein